MAEQLELELLEVVAEPYAVARVLASEQVQQTGALFVDVGGGTTDVALVRHGGIEGTRMFALGGRAFTKSIADRLDLPFPRAEEVKVDYARGGLESRADVVAWCADDVAIWSAGVELVLEELAEGDLLPSRVYMCGGGSHLPEIATVLRSEEFWRRLPFSRLPEIQVMAPAQVERIKDATHLLVDQQDVTPLGLAYQAIELQTDRRSAGRRFAPRPASAEDVRPMAIYYLDVDDEITSAAARHPQFLGTRASRWCSPVARGSATSGSTSGCWRARRASGATSGSRS